MRRALLIPFPALAAIMGLAYILGDPRRTRSHSFDIARDIAPLSDWGFLFLALAIAGAVALLISHETLLSVVLVAGGTVFTWWAVLFYFAAVADNRASLTGWAVHGTIAYWHFVAAWWIRTRR